MVEECDYIFSIVLIGDMLVGKTAIIQRFCNRIIRTDARFSFGETYSKIINLDGVIVKLEILNHTGAHDYYGFTSLMCRYKNCVILVYDVNNRDSCKSISTEWFHLAKESTPNDVEIMLLGNKCDIHDKRQVFYEEGKRLAKKFKIKRFFETSAKTGQNIEEAFHAIARDLIKSKENQSKNQIVPAFIRNIFKKKSKQIAIDGSDNKLDSATLVTDSSSPTQTSSNLPNFILPNYEQTSNVQSHNLDQNSFTDASNDLVKEVQFSALSNNENPTPINIDQTNKLPVTDLYQQLCYLTKSTQQSAQSEFENSCSSLSIDDYNDNTFLVFDKLSNKTELTEFSTQSEYEESDNLICESNPHSIIMANHFSNIETRFQQIQDSVISILSNPIPVTNVVNNTTNNNFERAQLSNVLLNTNTDANIGDICWSIQHDSQIQTFVNEIKNSLKETTEDINLLKNLVYERIELSHEADSIDPSEITNPVNINKKISNLQNSIDDIEHSFKRFELSTNQITNEFIQQITSYINSINSELEQLKIEINSIKANTDTNSSNLPDTLFPQNIKSRKLSFVTDFEVLYCKTIFQSTIFPMKQVTKLK